MADIATLGIKVENGDVIKATTSLNALTVAGGKSEAATQRLTRRMALLEIEARKMDTEMHSGAAAAARLSAELQRQAEASAKLELAARRQNVELQNTAKSGLASAGAIKSAFAALGLGLAIREVSTLADSYTNLRARLALVTTGTANLNAVQAALFETAQKTRTSFEATADLYGRIARNAAGLGASQADILRVTEAVSKAMVISGNSAETSAAAIMQLGQAFASGTLQGDEFRSIMENAPVLAQAIAKGLGVTVGELRKMSKEGTLTAQAVFDAIRKQGDALTTEFERIPRTISGAMQQMRNEVLQTLGGSGEMATATGGIVTSLDAIRNAIGPTARAVNAFFGGFSIAAADAALWMERLRQRTAEWQMAIGLGIRTMGNKTIGDALIGNAAKVMKDGGDITRMLEKQRDVTIQTVHAITEAGTVSTVSPPVPPKPPDLEALKKYKKLMEELRDVTTDLARAQLDAQIAAAQKNAEATAAIQDELTQSDLLLQAARQGEAAYKAQQREIEVLNELTRQGITLADQDYVAKKRAVEQAMANRDATKEILDAQQRAADEAERQMERQAKELHRTVSSTIEGIFTDIDQHRNPFVAIFENLKRGAIKAISDILATKIQAKVADILGIQLPASKQEKAGVLMNEAADKMLRAAGAMNGSVPGDGLVGTDPSKMPKDGSVAMSRYLQQFLKVGGAAYGGYQSGYGIGAATQSGTLGALGGAFTGAKLGMALGGPVGAAVGGVAGFIGGIIGAGDAARAARERLQELKAAFQNTFDSLKAELNKDTLGQAVAQVKSQYDAAVKQFKDANPLFGVLMGGADAIKRYGATLQALQEMEAQRIEQLKQEAALMKQQAQEDLDVRTLRNQGRAREAAILQKQHEDQRELQKAIEAGMSDAYLAQLRQNQAMEEAAVAAGKAADAINGLTTSMRNAPTGFKLEGYIQQYAKGAPYPGSWPAPTGPLSPPMSPLGGPQLSRTSMSAAPITLNNPTFNFPNITDGKVAAKAFLAELDKTKNADGGLNRTRSAALEKMTL